MDQAQCTKFDNYTKSMGGACDTWKELSVKFSFTNFYSAYSDLIQCSKLYNVSVSYSRPQVVSRRHYVPSEELFASEHSDVFENRLTPHSDSHFESTANASDIMRAHGSTLNARLARR